MALKGPTYGHFTVSDKVYNRKKDQNTKWEHTLYTLNIRHTACIIMYHGSREDERYWKLVQLTVGTVGILIEWFIQYGNHIFILNNGF